MSINLPELITKNRSEEIKQKITLENARCRDWGVSPKVLPILRKVFLWGMKASQAARIHGYNPVYICNLVRGLRERGVEAEIVSSLKPYEEKELEDLFWEKLKGGIQAGDIKYLELYAKVTQKAGIDPTKGAAVQLTQVNLAGNLELARRFVKRGKEG